MTRAGRPTLRTRAVTPRVRRISPEVERAMRGSSRLGTTDGAPNVPVDQIDTFVAVPENQVVLGDSSDSFLSGISGMGLSVSFFLTAKGRGFKPTIAATAHSDEADMARDKALISKAHKAGVKKVGLEITEVQLAESAFRTYFTALAEHARELGMKVVPLWRDETLLHVRSMVIALAHINAGRFDMGRLKASVARAEQRVEQMHVMSSYWFPENPSWTKLSFRMREAHARSMALEMVQEIRGDVRRFVEMWREICDDMASGEMYETIIRNRLRLAIMGGAHVETLSGRAKGFSILGRDQYLSDSSSLIGLIRKKGYVGNGVANLVLDHLNALLDKKGVERDEGTERQEFLIHILTQQPDVIQFTIRALVYTHPELASSINPNNSLEALMITCKEAKERVERIISDALHWFRFQE